jgi:hypothetical protein
MAIDLPDLGTPLALHNPAACITENSDEKRQNTAHYDLYCQAKSDKSGWCLV